MLAASQVRAWQDSVLRSRVAMMCKVPVFHVGVGVMPARRLWPGGPPMHRAGIVRPPSVAPPPKNYCRGDVTGRDSLRERMAGHAG